MPVFRSYSTLLIFLFYWLLSFGCYSQNRRIDSMENDLKQPKNDTVRITLFYNLAEEYYGYDTSKGLRYLEQGHALAEKMHYVYEIADFYEIRAKLFINTSQDMEAMPLLDTAIGLYKNNIAKKRSPHDVAQSQLAIATCNGQKGIVLSKQGKYKEAVFSYLESIEGWKVSDDPERNAAIANLYSNISTVYFDLKEPHKALEYDEAAIPYRLLDKNDELSAMTYLYIGDDLLLLSQPDSAAYYVQLAKPLVEKINKPKLNYNFYNRIAKIYKNKKEYSQAILSYCKAIDQARKTNNPFILCTVNRAIAECYHETTDYAAARNYLLTALPIADSNNYTKEKLEVLKDLVKVEDKSNRPAQAYLYLKQADAISDSIKLSESDAAVAEIENKYQSAQKEKEIIQLQKDKLIQSLSLKQKSILNYILFGSVAVLLVLGILLYRNYHQEKELQQKKISELEKDKQLMTVDAMLKGQEEERSRLAKDLHDGLGGMLSGVKYSLNNMKDHLIVTPDNMAVFERSLDMIDASIKELRRVAHNMMPEMLVKFGLNEALKEYANSINATKLLAVKYQSFGMKERLQSSSEIIIYRVVQELLNNVLKHASATEVLVQLIREENRLHVLVEDNGKGFDTASLENNKGAGWTNIHSRVDYLKGRLDIHSETQKGTSVSIEFNV